MRRILSCLCVVTFVILMFSGCSDTGTPENSYKIYYNDFGESGLSYYYIQDTEEDQDSLVMDLWKALQNDDEENGRVSVCHDDIALNRFFIENGNINLYFNSEYRSMNVADELLFRTAMVRTFTQISGIDSVTFFVDEKPLTNSAYAPLGAQKPADYVDIIGNGLSSLRRTTLTLYYADEEGTGLVKETQDVVYESSYSIEKDIIYRLISGPTFADSQRTLPISVQLISVSVRDKVCYLNFDSSFLTDALPLDGNLIIYSIVNSLTERSEVQKVQIMINGDSDVEFRGISLNRQLERNLNY